MEVKMEFDERKFRNCGKAIFAIPAAEAIDFVKSTHGVYFLTVFKESGRAIISDTHHPVMSVDATTEVWRDGKLVRKTSVREGTHH